MHSRAVQDSLESFMLDKAFGFGALEQAHSPCICICICIINVGNVDVDVGKPSTQSCKYQTRMKFYPRSLELPAYVRDM